MHLYSAADHLALKPAIFLALFGCAILIFDFAFFKRPEQKRWLIAFVTIAEAFVGISLWQQFHLGTGLRLEAFDGTLVVDDFSLFFNVLFVVASLITAIASYRYLEIEQEHHGEYYALILFAQCGMFFLSAGTDLVTLFLGMELMAISFYVLVGFLRGTLRSNEAAMKYLLLGAFSSGFLAYGFSLLYGIAGSTRLSALSAAIMQAGEVSPLLVVALATSGVGLLFKVSAAPFHMWAPDAYEGAPTPISALLSVGSKAASFALLIRILDSTTSPATREFWQVFLTVAAVLSLTIGNLAALTQTNTKRLLAYSSISHAGYMLLGLVAFNETGYQGVLIYLAVYTLMNLGAFLLIAGMRRNGLLGEDIDDLSGLMQRSPRAALLMLVILLSLAGIPPTAGFVGKFYILLALVQTGHFVLASAAALYVAVGVYYYFRVVRSIFGTPSESGTPLTASAGLGFALAITGVLTIGLGLYPQPLIQMLPHRAVGGQR